MIQEDSKVTTKPGVTVFGVFNNTLVRTQCPSLHSVSLKASGQVKFEYCGQICLLFLLPQAPKGKRLTAPGLAVKNV